MATKHEAGIRLLRAAFEDRTVRTAEEMQALCNAGGGLSYRWLQEIKGELGIVAERVGPGSHGYWIWRSPLPIRERVNGSLPARPCRCVGGPSTFQDDDEPPRCWRCGSVAG